MGLQQKYNRTENPSQLWDWAFREFGGMNTQAYRTSIDDEEFAWLENVQPIGHGNLKVVPQVSLALATVTTGTAYYAVSFNKGGLDYAFVACNDGSAYQILLTTPYTVTVIGAAATLNTSGVAAAQWKNLGIVIIDPVKGLLDWQVTAANTLTVIDNTVLGYAIAVYSGRVWVALNAGRTIQYTDADTYNSFAGSAGSAILVDPTLHNKITGLISANNFLYVWGDDSANTISDVRVVGGIASALFSNVNIQAMAGTKFAQSLFPYFRAIMFASPYGFYQLYGATPTKISDPMDGVFTHIDLSKPITGGAVVINSIVCAAFCFTYNDPTHGARQLLAVYFADKWFVSSQGAMKFIFSCTIGGKQTLFGCNGTSIFQLYSNLTASIDWLIRTKFYPFQSAIYAKSALKFGIEVNLPDNSVDMNVAIETPSTPAANYSLGANTTLVFVGTGPISFSGVSLISFVTTGFVFFAGDVSNIGTYLGASVSSSSPQAQITMLAMQYQLLGANWVDTGSIT